MIKIGDWMTKCPKCRIDISEEYCEIARQRLRAVDTGVPVKEQKIGQMAMFGGKDG